MADLVAELREAIEKQKKTARTLLSDIECPHNLDREIWAQRSLCLHLPAKLQEEINAAEIALQYLPTNLDNEINVARKRLQELIDSRDNKLSNATAQVADLRNNKQPRIDDVNARLRYLEGRRANTRKLYQEAQEELGRLQKRLKRVECNDALRQAQRLQSQLTELAGALPPALRGKSFDEIAAALANSVEEADKNV